MSWATTPVSVSVSVTSSLTVIRCLRRFRESQDTSHQNGFGFL
jgi:hypothetical protein